MCSVSAQQPTRTANHPAAKQQLRSLKAGQDLETSAPGKPFSLEEHRCTPFGTKYGSTAHLVPIIARNSAMDNTCDLLVFYYCTDDILPYCPALV